MSYIVKQYNQSLINNEDSGSDNCQKFLIPYNDVKFNQNIGYQAIRLERYAEQNSTNSLLIKPIDEGIRLDNTFNPNNVYYLHAKIRRMSSNLTINVQLIKDDDEKIIPQFVKAINIQSQTTYTSNDKNENNNFTNEWFDFEVLFRPVKQDFNCILFEVERAATDYEAGKYRIPLIVYQELSMINNFKNSLITNSGTSLIKFGIQASPSTMMCINGEEIHVGRSGIYEIRNGLISVNFLSVVKAGSENDEEPYDSYIVNNPNNIISGSTFKEILESMAKIENNNGENTYSQCFFKHPKKRSMEPFTIDYMYEDENNI